MRTCPDICYTTYIPVVKRANIPRVMLEKYLFRNAVATLEDALTHMTGIKQCEWLLTDDRPFTRGQWMTLMLSHFEEVSSELVIGFLI